MQKPRVPHYLKNTKNTQKIQKENKPGAVGIDKMDKKINTFKHKDISQLTRLELEKLLHMKGMGYKGNFFIFKNFFKTKSKISKF